MEFLLSLWYEGTLEIPPLGGSPDLWDPDLSDFANEVLCHIPRLECTNNAYFHYKSQLDIGPDDWRAEWLYTVWKHSVAVRSTVASVPPRPLVTEATENTEGRPLSTIKPLS